MFNSFSNKGKQSKCLYFRAKTLFFRILTISYRLLNRDDKAAATDKPVLITNDGQGLMEEGNKKI